MRRLKKQVEQSTEGLLGNTITSPLPGDHLISRSKRHDWTLYSMRGTKNTSKLEQKNLLMLNRKCVNVYGTCPVSRSEDSSLFRWFLLLLSP